MFYSALTGRAASWRSRIILSIALTACAPLQAQPLRVALAAGLAAGGTLSYFLTNQAPGSNHSAHQFPPYPGTVALAGAFLVHGRVLPAIAADIADKPIAAVLCVWETAAYFGLRSMAEPCFHDAHNVSTFITGGSGLVRYSVNRAWGGVREFMVDPTHAPRFFDIAPVWMANQGSGALLDLSSIALMNGLAYSALRLMPGQEDSLANFYQGYTSLGHYILARYSVTAVGSFTAAVCATTMTYAFPLAAATPLGRMPCHIARLGARFGMRYLLAYIESREGEDWRAQFWADERWRTPHDALTAVIRHRWWESTPESYMRELGALDYDEYEPSQVAVHGDIATVEP